MFVYHPRVVKKIFFLLLLFSLLAQADDREYRLEGGYTFGRFIGLHQNYAEADLFLLFPSPYPAHLFADLGSFWLQDNEWAGSFGLGLRIEKTSTILGINGYFDARHTPGGLFYRVGGGAEALSDTLDGRLNVYVPVIDHRIVEETQMFLYSSEYWAYGKYALFSYLGIDVELGRALWRGENSLWYLALGPYYYHQHDLQSFGGVQGRVEWRWSSLWLFECRASFDHVNCMQWQGRALFRYPLKRIDCEKRVLAQPVKRNRVMFLGEGEEWEWNW